MERIKKTPISSATKLSLEDYKNIRKFYNDGMHINTILRTYKIGNARLKKIVTNPNYLPGGDRKTSSVVHFKVDEEHFKERLERTMSKDKTPNKDKKHKQ
jgi:regulator of replication initiation timing